MAKTYFLTSNTNIQFIKVYVHNLQATSHPLSKSQWPVSIEDFLGLQSKLGNKLITTYQKGGALKDRSGPLQWLR